MSRLSLAPSRRVSPVDSTISSHSSSSRRLDHHPHERLGARRADEHPAAALERASTPARPPPTPPRRPRAPRGRRTRTLTSRWGSFSIASRSARSRAAERLEGQQRRRRAVAGRHEAGVDDVARLLAAERPAAAQQLREHVAVADRRRRHLDRRPRAIACGSRSWSSRSRPRRRPGSRPRSRRCSAASAISSSPSTTAPSRSTASTRSPSPSKAKPTSWPPIVLRPAPRRGSSRSPR